MKKKVLFTPGFDGNQYSENVCQIIQGIEETDLVVVESVNFKTLKSGFNAYDIAVVNWLENHLVNKKNKLSIKSFLKFLFKFLVLKIVARKLIYVRHNIYPHALNGKHAKKAKKIIDFFTQCADGCVVHSGHLAINKITYIPHPLYQFQDLTLKKNLEKTFIIFGRIVEYKSIDKLLSIWGKEKLLVAGKVDSASYLTKIENVLNEKKLKNVTLDARYVANNEAAEKVSSSSGLIISHSDQDMIVSGSFFFASSLGVPVFAVRTPFFDWLIKTYNYPGLFVYDDIETLVHGVSAFNPKNVSREEILKSAQNLFGDEVVKQYWKKLLINIE